MPPNHLLGALGVLLWLRSSMPGLQVERGEYPFDVKEGIASDVGYLPSRLALVEKLGNALMTFVAFRGCLNPSLDSFPICHLGDVHRRWMSLEMILSREQFPGIVVESLEQNPHGYV